MCLLYRRTYIPYGLDPLSNGRTINYWYDMIWYDRKLRSTKTIKHSRSKTVTYEVEHEQWGIYRAGWSIHAPFWRQIHEQNRTIVGLSWKSHSANIDRLTTPIINIVSQVSRYRERKCADTTDTVPVTCAGHFQCLNINISSNIISFRLFCYRIYSFWWSKDFQYTEAILSNSTRKLLWFEITKMLTAV